MYKIGRKRNNKSLANRLDQVIEENQYKILGRKKIKFGHKINKSIDYYGSILITGGFGFIGSALFQRIISKYNQKKEIILIDKETKIPQSITFYMNKKVYLYNFDLKQIEPLKRVFKMHKIDVVFHLAANKYIDLCQESIAGSVQENAINAINVFSLSIENSVEKFIFISSDKAVNPISNLGVSKAIAEKAILLLAKHANFFPTEIDVCITRLCNVFASPGSILDIVKTKTIKKEAITIFNRKLERFFITLEEAVDLLLFATSKRGIRVLIPYPGRGLNIFKLCQKTNEVIRQNGIEPSRVEINRKFYKNYIKLKEELVTSEEKYRKQKNHFMISF